MGHTFFLFNFTTPRFGTILARIFFLFFFAIFVSHRSEEHDKIFLLRCLNVKEDFFGRLTFPYALEKRFIEFFDVCFHLYVVKRRKRLNFCVAELNVRDICRFPFCFSVPIKASFEG